MQRTIFSALLALGVLTGCVTGTRSISPTVASVPDAGVDRGAVHIASIQDARRFEDDPRDPSTPSVSEGNVADLSAHKAATLVGRQRNTWGRAMGDVELSGGATVMDEMRKLLTEGLESRGYTVVDDDAAPLVLAVDVEEFWAWFTPGMWSVSFESRIAASLNAVRGAPDQPLRVKGHGINRGQVASDANWVLAWERGYQSFLEDLNRILDSAGL